MNAPWQSPAASRAAVAPRLAALAGIAAQVAAATTQDELTETITERASMVMGASRAALAVREGTDRLRTIATHGLTATEAQQWATLDLDAPAPLAEAVRTNQVVIVASRAELLRALSGPRRRRGALVGHAASDLASRRLGHRGRRVPLRRTS